MDAKSKLIAEENARHTAALKNLENTEKINMAVFDELDQYENEWITIINSLVTEKNESKIAELNKQKLSCGVNIFFNLKKVAPILYPDLKYMKSLDDYNKYFLQIHRDNVSPKVLRYEMKQKYDKDCAIENSKHDKIMKQLG